MTHPAPLRRPINWLRVARRQMLWVPLVPLAFALIFGAVAWYQAAQAGLLARHGVDTVARVTDRQTRIDRDSDGTPSTSYVLFYTYDAGLGEVFDSSQTVDRSLFERTQVGDDIPLRFVFHHPDLHEIETGDSRFIALVFGLFAALFGAVTLGLGLWMVRRSASLLRAARDGEIREARVAGHHNSTITVNTVPLRQAGWQDAAGQTGLSAPARGETLPAIGSVIVVYVDPVTGRGWWDGDF